MSFVILGLHPIESPDPCFLFEIRLDDAEAFDWGSVTQEIPGAPKPNWQTVWDEQPVGTDRWIFFFHFLDLDQPLATSKGSVPLPQPTPLPDRLNHVVYVPPC